MIEVSGDLWSYHANATVITTNGNVRRDGACVMGRGCALEAKRKMPGIEFDIGRRLLKYGNHVQVHTGWHPQGQLLMTFPVKHEWSQPADLFLIDQSARELTMVCQALDLATVVLPRPGCGNGGLSWPVVRNRLVELLDNRFHVITWKD